MNNGTPAAMTEALPAPQRTPRPFAVAIDPVALIVTECITVTSAMRKHARWAHSSVSAILGGGAVRPPPTERNSNHDRTDSAGSLNFGQDDEALASRWGLRGKKGRSMQDNPLLSAFARLRSDLKHCKDVRTFDTAALLQPFMQVIRSSSTTAPITSLALIAITKMLAYNVIGPDSPNFAHGMLLLSSTVTHCRFEADNTATDEVVFLRILKLMEIMITGSSGDILGDQSVCEMMECGLSLCCHLRTTEVLRRSAEISMVTMCQTIFQRLRHLDPEAEEEPYTADSSLVDDMSSLKIDSTVSSGQVGGRRQEFSSSTPTLDTLRTSDVRQSQDMSSSQVDLTQALDRAIGAEVKPYALPSIRELFRVLADLLDPFDRQHTDTMRVMALRIVNVALEVAGPSIAQQPTLASLAKDTLCRNLFQLVRSENLSILHESLRVAGTLLATCRNVLKLQQELYLSYVVACLHPRVPIPDEPSIDPSLYEGVPQAPRLVKPAPGGPQSGRSTPVPVKDRQRLGMEGGSRKPDARESMVESVGALVRIPSFMVELFVNYDCETDRSDLCLDMIGLLSRNAFPDAATWSTTNVPPLCLDSLLSYVQFIADRLEDEPETGDLPDREALREQRLRKKIVIKGVSKFNENPKAGIAFLASQGIIEDVENPRSITKFLKGTTRVDKKVLGEWLSKKSNEAMLGPFMELFDFTGQRVDEALRQLLNTFRLPGESQLIERIVTVFSEKYCANAPPEGITETDAVYVLTYAIIMLNTDQHNPNLKSQNRMAFTDFARNLRGVNGGKDFDQTYLQNIYDSIKTREIILPEEHDNKHAFDHAWKELLVKTQTADDLVLCNTNIYDADMFAATWQPVLATLNYVFMSATDDTVFQRVIIGFDQCAQIAARHGLTDCLDHIIASLSRISTLATESPPSTALNTEVQASGKSIMVSKFAVDFGRETKAELATLVLFRVINGHEAAIRNGWTPIVRIILNLFANSLIPTTLSALTKTLDLPPIPLQGPAQIIERNDKAADVGLFSAFTSYVSSVMNDEPPEPNDQEIEATLCTVDCINACRLDEVFANISAMPLEPLKALTTALLSMIPEDSSPRVMVVKPEVPAPTPVRPNGTKAPSSSQPLYDPTFVCLMELSTVFAIRDEETVAEVGKEVAEVLQLAIRNADRLHPVSVSRASFYLLKLLKASNDLDFLRAPVVLHTISSFQPDLLKQCAQPVLKGILGCIQGPPGLRNEMASSPDFWSLLHAVRGFPDAAPLAFQILEDMCTSTPSGITADNYSAAISLLNAFATAGSVSATRIQPAPAQRRGAAAGRGPAQPPSLSSPEKHGNAQPPRSDTVQRGVKAMTLIYHLTHRAPTFIAASHLEADAAWQAYWLPIFQCLNAQCVSPAREIRHEAFGSLQRCLLSADLASPEHDEWTNIFSRVLFPLIDSLLRREVYASDPKGIAEMRVQAAQLLCKIFLHYLVLLSEWDGMLGLWMEILGTMEALLRCGQGASLEEAVIESLKNILLVMSSGGYLTPPADEDSSVEPDSASSEPCLATSPAQTQQQKRLWAETWARLQALIPGLMPELFPAPPPRARPQRTEQSPQEQAQEPSLPVTDVGETASEPLQEKNVE